MTQNHITAGTIGAAGDTSGALSLGPTGAMQRRSQRRVGSGLTTGMTMVIRDAMANDTAENRDTGDAALALREEAPRAGSAAQQAHRLLAVLKCARPTSTVLPLARSSSLVSMTYAMYQVSRLLSFASF